MKILPSTEHRLRMSFDPEYELKYERLKANRTLSYKAVLSSMKSKNLLAASFWCGASSYLLTRSWVIAVVVPAAIWCVESLFYIWWEDRKKCKELGI